MDAMSETIITVVALPVPATFGIAFNVRRHTMLLEVSLSQPVTEWRCDRL